MEHAEQEQELGRCATLVGEIVDSRAAGDREENHGNSDDDLRDAVYALKQQISDWERSL